MYMLLLVPSLSMIVTVDDKVPSVNDKQLGNNLIAILNVSLSSCIISSIMSTLNDDDVDPAEMVVLNTDAVDMAKSNPAVYKITIMSQQYYCSTLPLADPSLIVTSTVTSSDALLFIVKLTVNESSLSATEY